MGKRVSKFIICLLVYNLILYTCIINRWAIFIVRLFWVGDKRDRHHSPGRDLSEMLIEKQSLPISTRPTTLKSYSLAITMLSPSVISSQLISKTKSNQKILFLRPMSFIKSSHSKGSTKQQNKGSGKIWKDPKVSNSLVIKLGIRVASY